MERRPRRPGLMERACQALELPADLAAGVPRLELTGDSQLRMENHRGYCPTARRRSASAPGPWWCGCGGRGWNLKAMTGAELLIRGRIACVSLE